MPIEASHSMMSTIVALLCWATAIQAASLNTQEHAANLAEVAGASDLGANDDEAVGERVLAGCAFLMLFCYNLIRFLVYY